MTKIEQIRALDDLDVEFAGLIFYPRSPRYVLQSGLRESDLKRERLKIGRVGVFVNADPEEVLRTVDAWRLDMVQLHGDESVKYCEQISNHVTTIKAFRLGPQENLSWKIHPFWEVCDMFLFDTVGVNYGGSGEKFDWDMLLGTRIGKPFFLSGGIGPGDVSALQAFAAGQPDLFALDVNSRFEIAPGIKDLTLLASFIQKIKSLPHD